jgi:hypothetical protein
MIMEGILNNWRGFINEGITSQGKIVFNYYAFDWDDNLMKMPTKILFKKTDTSKDEIVEVDTHSFAEIRSKLPELGLEYLPKDGSFINFRDNPEANQKFIDDSKTAPIVAGPWRKFTKAINMGSYFAIITARGHSPETLREAVKELIDAEREGISKARLIRSLKLYKKRLKLPISGDQELINEYLLNCQFSPVSHPSIAGNDKAAAASPEELKIKEFERFETSVKLKTQQTQSELESESIFIQSKEFKIGFSDDDIKNIKHFARHMRDRQDVVSFHTDPTTGRTSRFKDG